MTPEQLETFTILCDDFVRNVRWYQRPEFGNDEYQKDMLRDIDACVTLRLECVRESVHN